MRVRNLISASKKRVLLADPVLLDKVGAVRIPGGADVGNIAAKCLDDDGKARNIPRRKMPFLSEAHNLKRKIDIDADSPFKENVESNLMIFRLNACD